MKIGDKYLVEDTYDLRGEKPTYSWLTIDECPYLKDDEIIALKPDDIVKVNWRPMAEKKRETTDDAELYEIINEFTLRVCTPYAFAWLHNLKV